MKKYDYFISYSSQDEVYVNKIYELLSNEGKSVYKYNRCSNPGNIWEEISNGIDNSDVFLIFPSFDSEQSKAVKREFSIAMHRDVNDDSFKLIPVYLTPGKFINWAIDSQLRIESFDETPETTVKKILSFIENERLNYQQPNLPIFWKVEGGILEIDSKRNIILPKIRLLLTDEGIAKNNGSLVSFGGLEHEKNMRILPNGTKVLDINIKQLQYIGNNRPIGIELKDINIKPEWILDFAILEITGKFYKCIRNK
ncbi:toll/interleukin-1 receptor domain-containing protein [Mycoplasma marinum]|uniref:TIR domain-containing protein n=1 Tax=Mycoplasma marinum TaxID=1937190 RepID=A0A4R0XK03_9MOLU|nr:toll/interleukin-1 receptor domain-containing protein [Mycoplasma marinum]TCG10976.1 hypothetical protein C4B24_03375 [Mycoplasma marinum]